MEMNKKEILYNMYMLKRQSQALEITKELYRIGAIHTEEYKNTLLKLLRDAGFTNSVE